MSSAPQFNLPSGLSLRPMRDQDRPFIESLYRATREDLRLIDAEEDFIEELIAMQERAQREGYGDMFPNALYFVAEYHGERIGRATLDFGDTEIRVVDIALISAARGKGLAVQILRAVQLAASKIGAPVTLTVRWDNVTAKNVYLQLGFGVVEIAPPYERMVWYPPVGGEHGRIRVGT